MADETDTLRPVPEAQAQLGGTVTLHPVPEAQAQLGGIGRTTLYDLVARGELATVHIGRRMFIPSDAISDFIARRREAGATRDGGDDA